MAKDDSHSGINPAGFWAAFVRLLWMIIGSFTLAVCAVYTLMHPTPLLFWNDVLYGVTVPLMIIARYVDIKYFEGATAEGQPATMAHWRRYAVGLSIGSVILWLAVLGIAFALQAH